MSRYLGFYWTPTGNDIGDAGGEHTNDHTGKHIKESLDLLAYTGANTIFIPHRRIDQNLLASLRAQNLQVFVDWSIFAGEQLRQTYPDSIPIDAEGIPFERDGWYVPICPNHPQIRAHHLEAMANFLDQHERELAGLWLDFIRFPVRWEAKEPRLRQLCFCKRCLNLFLQADRGHYSKEETQAIARTILHERQEEWVNWKCARIAEFVQDAKAQITLHNRPLLLGMFALPWRRTDFDGAIRTIAGQDLGILAEHVDLFSPMVYHKLCHQPAAWVKEVVDDFADWTHQPILPIIQSVHQPDVMTPEQLDAALTYARNPSASGVMIFTLDPLLASKELAAVVPVHFNDKAPDHSRSSST